MNVLKDKKAIKELKKNIDSYINDMEAVSLIFEDKNNYLSNIDLLSTESEWIYQIHYLTEHALIKYSKIDLLKENFLSCSIDYMQRSIKIRLNNLRCFYRKNNIEITITIPILRTFNLKGNKYYKLYGNVKIAV